MHKAKLIALIAMLYAQESGSRAMIVKDAAKENSIKEGELYKLLKQEGYEPNAPKGTAISLSNEMPPSSENNNSVNIQQQSNNNIPTPESFNNEKKDKKVTVLVSHKTEYEKYRCAGLVLTRKPENYLVSESQFEKLSRDPWVTVAK
jgi:hypothetical protein